jgi:hypothetical protein
MTLVIAQLGADGAAHMLGDRAVRIAGTYTQSLSYAKVWQPVPSLVIGCAGAVNWLEAAQTWTVPAFLPREYAGLPLLRMVAAALADRAPKGATCQCIIATAGTLYPFAVTEDRSVAPFPTADGCAAIGSGALPALAALKVLGAMQTPEVRLFAAARVTAELMPGDVSPPFDLLTIEANAASTSASGSHGE